MNQQPTPLIVTAPTGVSSAKEESPEVGKRRSPFTPDKRRERLGTVTESGSLGKLNRLTLGGSTNLCRTVKRQPVE